jgi:excisionase family DNA binding protein
VSNVNGAAADGLDATRLLTSPEAARCLAISERLLWSLTKRGELPCVRIGRAVRYDPADLRAWIEACKVEAASEHLPE